jgi:TP901-1 family phage major tail protein
MAAQKGKDMLLKVRTAVGVFTTIAGLRARKMAFNAETVDVTDADSAGRWRELIGGAGVQRAALSGSGIFKDVASDFKVRELFFNSTLEDWQIIVPDFGIVAGQFQITALEYSGNHDGELTFEIALESAGALTFTVI